MATSVGLHRESDRVPTLICARPSAPSDRVISNQKIGTSYLYVDDHYRTDRSLAQEFGSADMATLRDRLKDRLQPSVHALRPLELFVRTTTPSSPDWHG